MPEREEPLEIALSAAWHAGQFGADLRTVDGIPLQIIHRGVWSHGLGPDFRDALILLDDRELRAGSIEVHLHTRGWLDHGHHTDPAYDDVILHVVSRHDGAETRRSNGGIVPVLEVGPLDAAQLPALAHWDWDRVGGQVCAPTTVATNPAAIRDLLFRLGDIRLAARSARIESRLSVVSPAELLWQEFLDGLGFSANREPMRQLASRVTVTSLEMLLQALPAVDRLPVARGILLGVANFLPLSPAESHLGHLTGDDVSQLEWAWHERGTPWRSDPVSSALWERARVRPANHPVPRLLSAANALVNALPQGGLLAAITAILTGDADPVAALRNLTAFGDSAPIGADRALDILASGVIPVALAVAAHTGNQSLAEAASRHWETLSAPAPNAVTRRAARQVAGSTPLGRLGARGSQGLIHLDTVLCQPRRCFECPVAAVELAVKG